MLYDQISRGKNNLKQKTVINFTSQLGGKVSKKFQNHDVSIKNSVCYLFFIYIDWTYNQYVFA